LIRSSFPLLTLLLLLMPKFGAAQTTWAVDLSAGYATYEAAAARIGSGSVIAGIRGGGAAPNWLYAYAGVPMETEGVFWGALGAGHRLAFGVGSVVLGIDLGAHTVGYRDSQASVGGGSATLEALPVIALRYGLVVGELRSGLLQNTDLYQDVRWTRRVHDSGLRVGVSVLPQLRVLGEARYMNAFEDNYPFVGGSLELSQGPVYAWASAGRWLTDTIATPTYGAGVSWQPLERWELRATWQQETNNPLYWNLPRQTWSIQLSRQLGRRPSSRLPPQAVAQREADGRVAIRISAAEAASVPSVLGEFTGWQPVPMTREGDFWVLRIVIGPGVYRYGFQDSEGRWFLPDSVANRVDDGMGGHSALLIVP
jgi:hypothetical protein